MYRPGDRIILTSVPTGFPHRLAATVVKNDPDRGGVLALHDTEGDINGAGPFGWSYGEIRPFVLLTHSSTDRTTAS